MWGRSPAGCGAVTVLDLEDLESGRELRARVAVVGAGAAGITLARALAARGLEVVVLEGGGSRPEAATQALHDLVPVGYPLRPGHVNRAREFGGSCNLWAGRCMRLTPFDLERRPWVAEVGWPFGWETLAPWLREAARLLGLPDPVHFDLAAHGGRVSADERRLLAAGPFAPILSLWARRPRRFARAHRRELAASRRITVVLHANATELETDAEGSRVVAVRARSLSGRELRVVAEVVVLACGGLEVPRLLLLSRRARPHGLGNEHDLVGRFFMDHPRTAYGRVTVRAGVALPLTRGWPLADGRVQLGFALPPDLQAREGLLHHYATLEEEHSAYTERTYRTAVEAGKVLLRRGHAGSRLDLGRIRRAARLDSLIYLLPPKEILPFPLWRAWRVTRSRLETRRRARRYVVVYFCEQPPSAESRVTLDDSRDALGLPRIRLDWRIPDPVHESLWRLQDHLARALRTTGLGELEPGEGIPRYTDASHHLGTTRMGATPREGVVDPELRVWSVANLYVASSAVFPTGGHANPTLTLLALTLRLADHLARRLAPAAVATATGGGRPQPAMP